MNLRQILIFILKNASDTVIVASIDKFIVFGQTAWYKSDKKSKNTSLIW